MPLRPWRLLLTGGGTGGHIYPALAIAEAARARLGPVDILFVGGAGGMEERLVPQAGLPFEPLPVRGVVGKRPAEVALGSAALARALARALRLVGRFRPRVVVGTGGYAAAPVCLAAVLRRVPLLLQEQNAVPGLTNRLLARFAGAVAVPYAEALRRFPPGTRAFVAGNPVRAGIAGVPRQAARQRLGLPAEGPVVLCVAGSRGSAVFVRLLDEWLPHWRGGTLLFVSGEAHRRAAAEVLSRHGVPAPELLGAEAAAAGAAPGAGTAAGRAASLPSEVRGAAVRAVPYLTAVGEALAAADLVVCRAGALTLAEVAAAGRPAVLIPSPHVTHGHQEANAAVFARAGAAVVLREAGLDGARLAAAVQGLLARPQALRAMAEAARGLARPDAAERILRRVAQLAGLPGGPGR